MYADLKDADLVPLIGFGTDREAEAELFRRMAPRAASIALGGLVLASTSIVEMSAISRGIVAVVLGLVDGISLQLTFDPKAFGLAEAARFCDDALARYLAKETP